MRRWNYRTTIPARAHPLVKEMYALMIKQRASAEDVCDRAGLGKKTIPNWRHTNFGPQLGNFEAALNALGYELKIVRKRDEERTAA